MILKKPFDNVEVLQLAHALTRKWELNREVQGRIEHLDKTIQQKTEEKERTMALLEAALEHSPSGIIVTDAKDAAILWINSAALNFCNDTGLFSRGNEIGSRGTDWQVLREDGTDYVSEELPILRATGKGEITHSEEIIIRNSQGMERWLSVNAAPIRYPDGSVVAGIFLFQDITERKQAAMEHERLLAELHQAQKMESIGVLAGGISHDFNNLLQVISGNIELMLMDRTLNSSQTALLATVSRAVDRTAELTRQLLIFSRKADIQKKKINPNAEIVDVFKILKRTIPRMIRIELNLDDAAWTINADRVQFAQVLLNLCSNAAEAMEGGGRLVVKTSNEVLDSRSTPTVPDMEPGRYLLMSVSDTGVGMDPDTLDHIFEPFFTTKEVGKGTGLGLATVYGIIKGHGGHILCSSNPGQGTTFNIYWPVRQEREDSPNMDKSEDNAPKRGNETILAVDDEPFIRVLYKSTLESYGYKVYTAINGEDALSVYAEKGDAIQVVILDLNMPGMSGKQFLHELLLMSPSARVIIASGYVTDAEIKDLREAGAMGFIDKPHKISDLLAKVREVLDLPSPSGNRN
ncbi:MAG: Blue-light-activated protein [Syntrophus sp. PtaU1.Bin208]|nr:MAG: Blue-light-activated protein [Syntrophus sp. PtaU1.Bin208]